MLIYLLSTTLVFPTFTTPTAVAKDNTDDMNQQTKVTHKSSQSKEDKQEQTDSNQRAHQAEKASSEKSPSKENGKSSKTHKKIMMLKRIKTKHPISQIKILTSSIKLQQQLLIKISKKYKFS